jgi:hypothetical protein
MRERGIKMKNILGISVSLGLVLVAPAYAWTPEEQDLIQSHYDLCLRTASNTYLMTWSSSCDDLLNGGKITGNYMRDGTFLPGWNTSTCKLPLAISDRQDLQYERDKDRCLREFQAGVR